MSDDQLMETAEKMCASEHSDNDFMLKHIWKVVRGERKWSTYNTKNGRGKRKKNMGVTATKRSAEVVNLDDTPLLVLLNPTMISTCSTNHICLSNS